MQVAAPAALAVVIAAGFALAWSGRWRGWTRSALTADGGVILGLMPLVALNFAIVALGGAGVLSATLVGRSSWSPLCAGSGSRSGPPPGLGRRGSASVRRPPRM